MKVYFRSKEGLGCSDVDTTDHELAILMVKEDLVYSGFGWQAPVLAVINGGDKDGSSN